MEDKDEKGKRTLNKERNIAETDAEKLEDRNRMKNKRKVKLKKKDGK